jgi:uncharacterized BrkB/YihY/UPF0761 family membrane protein
MQVLIVLIAIVTYILIYHQTTMWLNDNRQWLDDDDEIQAIALAWPIVMFAVVFYVIALWIYNKIFNR